MKILITFTLSLLILSIKAQDIPYMSGRIDYVKKGDHHLNDSSYLKALSTYEKGLKKQPEDSLVFSKRIAKVTSIINGNESDPLKIEAVAMVMEPSLISWKPVLFDLGSLSAISANVQVESLDSGEILVPHETGFFKLIEGEEYKVKGSKAGYYDVEMSILADQEMDAEELLMSTSKIQENEIVVVQSAKDRVNVYELSGNDFFERTTLSEDAQDYLIQSIYFDFDQSQLPVNTDLSSVVTLMNKFDHLKLEIRGFTDSRGRSNYNKQLAEKRVEAVVSALVSKDVSKKRLKVVPVGEENLTFCTDTESCPEATHAMNRRVDFVLTSDLKKEMQVSVLYN